MSVSLTKTNDENRADAHTRPEGFESVGTILTRILAGQPDLMRAVERARSDERRAAQGSLHHPTNPDERGIKEAASGREPSLPRECSARPRNVNAIRATGARVTRRPSL
jgi:hypothetical protein